MEQGGAFSMPDKKTAGNDEAPMHVKVISLDRCQATPQTIRLVEEVAREMGLAIKLEHVIVQTPEEAEAHRHIGSPTVLVDGRDIEPAAREANRFGIT